MNREPPSEAPSDPEAFAEGLFEATQQATLCRKDRLLVRTDLKVYIFHSKWPCLSSADDEISMFGRAITVITMTEEAVEETYGAERVKAVYDKAKEYRDQIPVTVHCKGTIASKVCAIQ